MKMTTVCYIRENSAYLMLHRTKKKNDPNHDKYIGIGGKFEDGESPEDCILREIHEEVGMHPKNLSYRGIITFVSTEYGTEYMHLFTATGLLPIEGGVTQHECEEGDLVWISKEKLWSLPMWEGDRIFLELIEKDTPFFSLKLCYQGETLIGAFLDGEKIK